MRPALSLALAASLVATAVLAWWPGDEPLAVVAAAERRPRPALATAPAAEPSAWTDRTASPGAINATATGATATGAVAINPIAVSPGLSARPADWSAPPAAALAAWQAVPGLAKPAPTRLAPTTAPVPTAPAPAAAAPVFPYAWIGQLDDGGATPQLLLASAERSVAVRLGATLDGRWQLNRGADGTLLVVHLPSGSAAPVRNAPRAAPT